MVILGLFLTLLGAAICFRGVYILGVFKAIMGAIQGLIYALLLRVLLALLQAQMGNIFWIMAILIACLMAYLAAVREKIYQRIQGIVNAALAGGALAAILYIIVRLQSYSYYGRNTQDDSAVTVMAVVLFLAFIVMGAKWYRAFRKIGVFLLAFLVLLLLLTMHMSLDSAAVVALLLASLFLYLLIVLDRYLIYLKVSSIGAVVAVAGLLCVFGMSHMMPMLPQIALANLQRMLSHGGLFTAYETETALSALGILILTILGTLSQVKYVKAHTDESGALIIAWPEFKKGGKRIAEEGKSLAETVAKGAKTCARNIGAAVSSHRRAIAVGAIIVGALAVVAGIGIGLFYGGREIYKTVQYQQNVRPAGSATELYVEEINSLYGSTVISSSGVSFVGASGDGFDSSLTMQLEGAVAGEISAVGISDPETGDWYPLEMNMRLDNGDTDAIARLFAAAAYSLFGVDSGACESAVLATMHSVEASGPHNAFTPVDIEGAMNTSVSLYLNDGGWTLSCARIF